jgi:hypothetical protein
VQPAEAEKGKEMGVEVALQPPEGTWTDNPFNDLNSGKKKFCYSSNRKGIPLKLMCLFPPEAISPVC